MKEYATCAVCYRLKGALHAQPKSLEYVVAIQNLNCICHSKIS